MTNRKELKMQGKASLKKHYLLFLLLTVIAAFLSTGFSNSLDFLTAQTTSETDESTNTDAMITTVPVTDGSVPNFRNVVTNLLSGNLDISKQLAEEIKNNTITKAEESGAAAFGRSRGVLASIINTLSSGAFLVTLSSAINSITHSSNYTVSILIVLSTMLMFLFWFFVKNTFVVLISRMFLEGRIYQQIPPQRLMFLPKVKKWTNASWVLFVKSVYSILWFLTIVGGFIKYYSYFMVPYIVAENPSIGANEAITLSRKMMNGHKWECFVLHISFFWWYLLDTVTFGISAFFFTDPYRTSVLCEYYVSIRSQAKDAGIPGVDALNDTYLYEAASADLLTKTYSDIVELKKQPQPASSLTGIRGFLAKWFGLVLTYNEEEKRYEEGQARAMKIRMFEQCMDGTSYPTRLYPLHITSHKAKADSFHYLRHYSLTSIIMLFFSFSFIGWVWEVSLHLIADGVFVNRGTLHGPWLPIYGGGGVLILLLLNRLRKKPVIEFISAVILCGFVEYFTAYYLEMTHGGTKWWDYSGYFLNLNGRICAEGLLVFGLGGMAIVYLGAPVFDNLFRKINQKILIPVCIVLLSIYIGDSIYSHKHPNMGEGITNYKGAITTEDQLYANHLPQPETYLGDSYDTEDCIF